MSLRNRFDPNSIPGFPTQQRWELMKENATNAVKLFEGERLAQVGFGIIGLFTLVAIFAPLIAPHPPGTTHRGADGGVLRIEGPMDGHILGTTQYGQDIFSQLVWSARTSLFVGFFAAVIAVFVGMNVALISAYYGGWVDSVLMRITDIAYGLPFLPFVLVLVFIFEASLINMVLAIAILLWRDTARVVRSEVLTQKERPYIEAARTVGASDSRIMYRHILPNVVPLVVLYLAFAVAYAIIFEASVAFLGFSDPAIFSWGQMMFMAYTTGAISYAWWWVLPPGLAIMLTVMAVFFIGRSIEKVANPDLRF